MTERPDASCNDAALCAPTVAAAHSLSVAFSSCTTSVDDRPSRMPPPSCCVRGPDNGIDPLCVVAAVASAYPDVPSNAAATSTPTSQRRPFRPSSSAHDGDRRRRQHDPAQPRQPGRRAVEQDEAPHAGRRDHRDQRHPHREVRPAAPELTSGDADERGDRRCQRDGVVRVRDAAHEAEHQAGDQHPAAPQHQCRTRAVGPRGAPGEPQPGDEADQRRGQQPRDLRPHARAEQPPDARRATEPDVPVAAHSAAATARAAASVAEDAAQPVVADRQFPQRVVGRPADVRAALRRPQRDERDVPPCRDDHGDARSEQVQQPLRQRRGSGDQVGHAPARAAPGSPAASW